MGSWSPHGSLRISYWCPAHEHAYLHQEHACVPVPCHITPNCPLSTEHVLWSTCYVPSPVPGPGEMAVHRVPKHSPRGAASLLERRADIPRALAMASSRDWLCLCSPDPPPQNSEVGAKEPEVWEGWGSCAKSHRQEAVKPSWNQAVWCQSSHAPSPSTAAGPYLLLLCHQTLLPFPHRFAGLLLLSLLYWPRPSPQPPGGPAASFWPSCLFLCLPGSHLASLTSMGLPTPAASQITSRGITLAIQAPTVCSYRHVCISPSAHQCSILKNYPPGQWA